MTVRSDQQAAGLIMKLLGGFYLWGIIIVKFIGYSRIHHRENQQMRPADGRHLRVGSSGDDAVEAGADSTGS